MTRDELALRLEQENVPKGLYDLYGAEGDDKLCLTKALTGWGVYYLERGQPWDVQRFRSESDACEHFYQRIRAITKAM